MNKVTNEQLDSLIKSAVNSSGPLPHDEKFSQIISALRELRTHRNLINERGNFSTPTNNHPANGPVSLDRLRQISEILSKAAAQSDGGNLGYAMADAVKVINGAIASSGMKPYGYVHKGIYESCGTSGLSNDHEAYCSSNTHIALYTSPPVRLVNTIDETLIEALRLVQCMLDDYRERNYGHAQEWIRHISAKMDDYSEQHGDDAYSVISAAMLQAGNFREIPNSSTNNCREIAETSTNENEIETHTLLKSIEGMEVSVDVSTCDADAGHRYFGTVTEISELDTAKNGYILLVQDAKPNFKQAGNSPVIPDGWVVCSERMPENDDFVYIWTRPDFGVELHVAQYGKFDKRDAGWYAQVYEQNYGIEYYPVKVTHWMPLPAAPQQEVK